MLTRTRRSAASNSPSSVATPVSALSLTHGTPTHSTPASTVVPDSEEDELPLAKAFPKTRPRRAAAASVSYPGKGKKRAAVESDGVDDDGDDGSEGEWKDVPSASSRAKKPSKRRRMTLAYVEMPSRTPSLESMDARSGPKSKTKATGKAKASVPSEPSSEDELSHPLAEESIVGDDEDAVQDANEDDDDSGSEFGENSSDFDESDEDEDGEDEDFEEDSPGPSNRTPRSRRTTGTFSSPARANTTKKQTSTRQSTPEVVDSDIEIVSTANMTNMKTSKKESRDRIESEKMTRLKRDNPIKYEVMKFREKYGRKPTWSERATIALGIFHPELKDAWGDLEANLEVVVPVKAEQPSGLKCKLLPFQLESLSWMRLQELGPYSGGLLADEMGMGKTIQMISLMVSEPGRPNLVIAPTVAVMQWRNEIEAHTDDMKVVVWHGASRETNIKELVKYDVVLTTYAVVESCFRKQVSGFKRKGLIVKEKSPLHLIKWNRVILDEAHNIKERATNTAKATFELSARYRWCLSGTPLQNRVGELYSLIRFLNVDPFSFYYCKSCDCRSLHWRFTNKKGCDECGHSPMQHTCFWNNEILTPIQKNAMVGPGRLAFKKLRILLDRIMLRRTKVQRADDLGLPPRTIIIKRDYFSTEEKELYLSLFSDAKREFSTYVDAGTLLNNYSNVFSLLTRMRQMACHPDLVIRSKKNAGAFVPDDTECTVCRLCNDVAEDAIQAKCKHIFDRECIRQYLSAAIQAQPDCPICHVPLTIDLDAEAIETEQPAGARQGILGRLDLDSWRSSTKIEALVEELDALRHKDATTKSIVFSQFVNFLDLIAFRLRRAGFVVCRLEGTMSPQARDATIKHFMNNVHVTVFLVSLKAGGVALNLTEASRVYLMDSWWNPAVEFQAMDRIHRLGQHRPVQAIKLVVEDSIESRIIQLQEKKSAMVDATLSTDDEAMGRLTPEDLSFLFRL